MEPIRCFLVNPTDHVSISLRRFTYGSDGQKCVDYGHDAQVVIDTREPVKTPDGCLDVIHTDHSDPRWPTHCVKCGYEFQPTDQWQTNQHTLYTLAEGNEAPAPGPWTENDLPVGAMFYPSWLQPKEGKTRGHICPTEGSVLTVIIPNNPDGTGRSQWIVDAYCNNCDRKGQEHHCWCRRGTPPNITVDKTPPDELGTCNAGAGSIWTRFPLGWHGFLKNGFLTQA